MTGPLTIAEMPKPIAPEMADDVARFLLREVYEIYQPQVHGRDSSLFTDTLSLLARDVTVIATGPDQTILGVGIVRPESDRVNATLIDLAVHYNHRREGIGSRVLSEVEKVTAEAGHETLSLLPMYGTFGFYQANGYARRGNGDMYAKDLS